MYIYLLLLFVPLCKNVAACAASTILLLYMLVEYYLSGLTSVDHSLSLRLKGDSMQQDYAATHQSGLLSRLRGDSAQPDYTATHQLGINHHSPCKKKQRVA